MTNEPRYTEQQCLDLARAYAELGIMATFATTGMGTGKKYLNHLYADKFLEHLDTLRERLPRHLISQFPKLNELEEICLKRIGNGSIKKGRQRLETRLRLKRHQENLDILCLCC